jgi:hypothetical protein
MRPTPLEALMQRAQDRPKDVAFIFGDKAWTYEMIASESERLAAIDLPRKLNTGGWQERLEHVGVKRHQCAPRLVI